MYTIVKNSATLSQMLGIIIILYSKDYFSQKLNLVVGLQIISVKKLILADLLNLVNTNSAEDHHNSMYNNYARKRIIVSSCKRRELNSQI